jgi:hypothetical protein
MCEPARVPTPFVSVPLAALGMCPEHYDAVLSECRAAWKLDSVAYEIHSYII